MRCSIGKHVVCTAVTCASLLRAQHSWHFARTLYSAAALSLSLSKAAGDGVIIPRHRQTDSTTTSSSIMPPRTPTPLISVDITKKAWEQEKPLHNRWHPDIPAVAEVSEGELFRVETIDWTGGQIADDDSAEDIKKVDLSQVHYLSGPIRVVDKDGAPAQPGDLLCVELCNLGPLPGDEWGFTGTFDRENGGGFLTDHFPAATKAVWHFDGIYASSRHIPGVRFAGLIHPGLIGTAPSKELLDIWNEREGALVQDGPDGTTLGGVLHTRPLACLPEARGACLGSVEPGSAEWDRIAAEGARTVPGRENGGNCDIKNLTRGCRVYLPVFVEGANLSMGDMHFSQGDGEVSFCGAIEMSGFLEVKCEVIKGAWSSTSLRWGPPSCTSTPFSRSHPWSHATASGWCLRASLWTSRAGSTTWTPRWPTSARCSTPSTTWQSLATRQSRCTCCCRAAPVRAASAALWMCPTQGASLAVATLAIPTAIFDQDVRPKKGGIPPQGVSLRGRGDVAKAIYDGSLPLTINQCLCHSMTGQPAHSGGAGAGISEADVAGASAE
ncbi:formamidase [Scenedesmus sp. NREL 46B-D3]|nr:formamidase [Scenedesmus sp. NREL 46B-D3]